MSNNNALDQYLSVTATDGTENDTLLFYVDFDGKLQTDDLSIQNIPLRICTYTQYLGGRVALGNSNLAELYGKLDLEGKSSIVIDALRLLDLVSRLFD